MAVEKSQLWLSAKRDDNAPELKVLSVINSDDLGLIFEVLTDKNEIKHFGYDYIARHYRVLIDYKSLNSYYEW